jgi:hypothetical protein
MKGMPGNEGQTVEARQPDTARDKLYYPTGKLAAQAFNRRKSDNCYWRAAGDQKRPLRHLAAFGAESARGSGQPCLSQPIFFLSIRPEKSGGLFRD